MTVRQCIIEVVEPGRVAIVDRVEIPCELLEAPDGSFFRVRLLQDGAGLPVGAELTVPATEVTP